MTFSIVARDPVAGHLGAGIATARPCVGGRTLIARRGTALVVTQATVNTPLGVEIADALDDGDSPSAAFARGLAADPGRDRRQLLAVSMAHAPHAYTGSAVPDESGERTADHVAVAGNLLRSTAVLDGMIERFQAGTGDLVSRIIDALDGGDRAGGDARGRQSAAVLVYDPGGCPLADLRVDDAGDPVAALRYLHKAWDGCWGHYDRTGVFPPAEAYPHPLATGGGPR
ncbi:DUF1028 domain-containing protein [Sinosporangium siamense]|uniref:Pilus assembly protein n=1 Tax=Sinosporangium siamense TaxID=1367973 RepID=A0A919RF30_9ACTN|nr:DUF1028 domain-containing protein [Sinosporangium siamense]GII90594.1 pilus assembly protein [Sinosporangium siamense]